MMKKQRKKKKGSNEEEDEEDEISDNRFDDIDEVTRLAKEYFPNETKSRQKELLDEFADESGYLAGFADRHLKLYKDLETISNSVYQWLPTEMTVHPDSTVTVDSYINNLDEKKYPELFKNFGNLFRLFLPYFEQLNCIGESSNIQVIVKAANYILEPGETYEGNWHIEGTPNEHIIASGIYYYHVDKELKSQLAFREKREMGDRTYAPQSQSFQINLGKVDTIEDRCVIFSNTLQHKVRKMVNNTNKRQLRKIICFFLINPSRRIHSSVDVPKQQWEKTKPTLMALIVWLFQNYNINVPKDVVELIASHAKIGFTREEAETHRTKLMEERKAFVQVNDQIYTREFSYCEH